MPTVSFVGEPRATHRSVLKIDVDATDDYGIAELALLLAPKGREDETERVTLLKPGNQPPHLATGAYQDLTAHPLAGLTAVLRLEAVDAIGQRGQSGPIEIVLPAREFRHPLARAIIAERRKLVATPEASDEVAATLDALGDTPAAQNLPAAVPLGLRVGCGASGDESGRRGEPEIGGRPVVGARAVHRGRLALARRAQAARPPAGAAAGARAGCGRTPSSSG